MSQKLPKWDNRFLQLANTVSTFSSESSKTGCVLASPDHRQVAFGYNGPVRATDPSQLDGLSKQERRKYIMHAEANAMANAVQDIHGWTAYVTRPPCLDCAKALIQAGIKRIVTYTLNDESSWLESQKEASSLFSLAGVAITYASQQ